LEAGEIDIGEITSPTSEVLARVERDPNVDLVRVPWTNFTWLAIDHRHEALSNPLVREALQYAIDREGIIEFVLGGAAVPAYSVIPPGFMGFSDEYPSFDYDPERARSLLAEAGYPDGFSATFTARTEGSTSPWFEPIIANLNDVGIDLEVRLVDNVTWWTAVEAGEVEMGVISVTPAPDPEELWRRYLHSDAFPPGRRNLHFYSGMDDLLDRGASATETDARVDAYRAMMDQFLVDFPIVPLAQAAGIHAVRTSVDGYVGDPMRGIIVFTARLNAE